MTEANETFKTNEKIKSFEFYISQLKQNIPFLNNYQSIFDAKKDGDFDSMHLTLFNLSEKFSDPKNKDENNPE